MSPADDVRQAAEQRARVLIDAQLVAAGWTIQDKKDLNLFAADGVAVREVVMAVGHGRADYLLYVDQQAVGVIEAKPAGRTLSGVEWLFEDRIDTSDVMEMHWPDETLKRFRLHPGDVLLNEGQTPDLLGRPALYRGEPAETAFTNSLIRFRANDDVLPEFALLVFRRHMRAGRFKRESRITTNIAHLSAARLKPIEFPIPPLQEQERLLGMAAERLDAVSRLDAELAAARGHQSSLRRSLLDAAFSGRLTAGVSDGSRSDVIEDLARV